MVDQNHQSHTQYIYIYIYMHTCFSSRIFYRPTNSTFLLHVILNLLGWGGVGHVNVRLHLRHEVDAASRMGLGLGLGGVGHVNLRLHLRHEVDAT